jgi:hypothetical protein
MNDREGKVTTYNSENTRTVLKTDSIVDSVIDRLIDRARVGKNKYNTDLDREDLGLVEWIQHLQEELMDAVNYLEKIKVTISGKKRSY